VCDVTAAETGVSVAMGDDDYVILNSDLSFYYPPETDSDPGATATGVGAPRRCAPWLGLLDPAQRSVFVELDSALRSRYDVTTCAVQTTSSATESGRRREVSWFQGTPRLGTNTKAKLGISKSSYI